MIFPTLEERVIAWLNSEGLAVGGAPCARGTSLVAFIKKETKYAVSDAFVRGALDEHEKTILYLHQHGWLEGAENIQRDLHRR